MKGVVSVAQGRLRGVWRGDLWSFSGIPYAQAPVGGLRWRPPLPPPTWSEIRDASTFGPIAPQSVATPGITSPSDPETSEPHSEDCLSLNIWTPELPSDSGAEPREGQTRHGVHPRGRVHLGQRFGVLVPGRQPGAQWGRRGGDHQLQVGRTRFSRSPRPCRAGRPRRKLGDPRPAVRVGLGARQHRRLRRRSGQRHHLRRVGGGLQRRHPARHACRLRPLPPRRSAEWWRARAHGRGQRSVRRIVWRRCWVSHRVPGSRSNESRRPSSSPPPRRSGGVVRIRGWSRCRTSPWSTASSCPSIR